MRERTFGIFLVVAIIVLGFALVARAWPPPVIEGDCEGWYVTEVATDQDWEHADIWTIDGINDTFTRGETVFIPDETNERFGVTVRWYEDVDGEWVQRDKKEAVGERDLSECQETTTTTLPPTTTTSKVETTTTTEPSTTTTTEVPSSSTTTPESSTTTSTTLPPTSTTQPTTTVTETPNEPQELPATGPATLVAQALGALLLMGSGAVLIRKGR